MRFELVDCRRLPLQTVDELVEAFEAAFAETSEAARQRVNLLDYLPAESDQHYLEVAAELIRIDMEHSWSGGENKRLDSYRSVLPKVFRHQATLSEIAYEEYRLRAQAGEQVSAEQYQSDYGILTDTWARWNTFQQTPASDSSGVVNSQSNIPGLWQEALELAEDVQDFPSVGESFSGFVLEEKIGQGAFSLVFLARQDELAERQVVLKIASGATLEPQHLARLQHTNIVPIYSVHRQANLTAVCMPYFGHRTLVDLLAVVREEPAKLRWQQNLIGTFLNHSDPTEQMPVFEQGKRIKAATDRPSNDVGVLAKSSYVDAVVWLVQRIAEGLAHAHERGIVHRDLKPANVLLTTEGMPMLLDFNLSQDVVVNGRTSLLAGGTLPYMAPEHLEAVISGGPIGYQADIFSMGVIFHELLTGERPFSDHGGAFEEVVRGMMADREERCVSLRTKNPAIPRSIEAVVQRCLASDIQARYSKATELVEDLERHLHSEPLLHAPDRSIAERSKKWLQRHPRLTSAGGVAAIASCALAMLVGAWMLRGHRLARLEAEKVLQEFREQQPPLRMALGLPYSDPQILQESIASSRGILRPYALLEDKNWRDKPEYQSLTAADRRELDRRLAETLFLLARAKERLLEIRGDLGRHSELAAEALKLNQLAVDSFFAKDCPAVLIQQQTRLLGVLGKAKQAGKMRQGMNVVPAHSEFDHYARLYDMLVRHEFAEAEQGLIELRDRHPNDPLSWVLLGDAQVALHQLNEAEGAFTTAVALDQDSFQAYYHRGRCRLDLRKYSDALEDFDRMIALRPQLSCGYLNRALAHRSLKSYEEAIEDLSRALELGATESRIYFLRSKLFRLLGDEINAKEDWKVGLELTPSDTLSWISRGVAQLQVNPEAALSDFKQALQLNPVSRSALLNCVHVYADRLNKPAEALEAIRKLLLINERDTDALASRAVLQARAGAREAALEDIQQLLRLSKEPKSLFQAACALSLTSQPENLDAANALTLISQAVQLDSKWLVRAHTDPDLKALRETAAFQSFSTNIRKINQMKIDLKETHEID